MNLENNSESNQQFNPDVLQSTFQEQNIKSSSMMKKLEIISAWGIVLSGILFSSSIIVWYWFWDTSYNYNTPFVVRGIMWTSGSITLMALLVIIGTKSLNKILR